MSAKRITDPKTGKNVVPASELDKNAPDYAQKIEDGFITLVELLKGIENNVSVGTVSALMVALGNAEHAEKIAANFKKDTGKIRLRAEELVGVARGYVKALEELTEITPMFDVNKDYTKGTFFIVKQDAVYRTDVDLWLNTHTEPVAFPTNAKEFPTSNEKLKLVYESRNEKKNIWIIKHPAKRAAGSAGMIGYAINRLQDEYKKVHPEDVEIMDSFKRGQQQLELINKIKDGFVSLKQNLDEERSPEQLEKMVCERGESYYRKMCGKCPNRDDCGEREMAKKIYNL